MINGLGERLQRQRQILKLSQKEVAAAIGVSASIISNYESSERVPSVENLMSLANLYKCSVDYLLGLEKGNSIVDTSHLNDEQILLLQRFLLSISNQNI